MLPSVPTGDACGESRQWIGTFPIGLRAYRTFVTSAGKLRCRVAVVAYSFYEGLSIGAAMPAAIAQARKVYGDADQLVFVQHEPLHGRLGRFDPRGRPIYMHAERWWQYFALPTPDLYRIVEIDRRTVEGLTNAPWRQVRTGVDCGTVAAEWLAAQDREARMFQGDRATIERMRALTDARRHRLVEAEARIEVPGWHMTETYDAGGVRHLASGTTFTEWAADFTRTSACPAFPPAVGDGATILRERGPVVCTIVGVERDGERLRLRADRAMRVDGGVERSGTYRYDPDELGAEYVVAWIDGDRSWYLTRGVSGPAIVVLGRREHEEVKPWMLG